MSTMGLLPVDEAKSRILDGALPTEPEDVALREAFGRVLAADVQARITQPPFNSSAMDGYAVRAADVKKSPTTLKVVGEAPAGAAYRGAVGPGEAVRIFTGAPVPDGADTIVIQENTEVSGSEVNILTTPRRWPEASSERGLSSDSAFANREALDFKHARARPY